MLCQEVLRLAAELSGLAAVHTLVVPLRRWLPKGTPLDLSPQRLSIIEDNLNWMPRRLHNWQSAADIYTQLTRNHQ